MEKKDDEEHDRVSGTSILPSVGNLYIGGITFHSNLKFLNQGGRKSKTISCFRNKNVVKTTTPTTVAHTLMKW